jgi:peptide/nickel transport system substrate-binding protein
MGGELTYGLEAETGGGFCLTNAQLVISGIVIADSVYDTLVVPDENGEMVPFLAKAVTPNADYTAWTIELRPGITFHDGTPLDAAALKLNLDGYVKGILFQFALGPVQEVAVTGPLTVDVKMSEPWYKFPQTLWGWGRIGIMAPAQINSPDCATKMIGTGPFTLDSRELNVKTVVKKNPNYWLSDKEGNKLPYLDQITFVPQPNATQRVNAFVSGSFNALHTNSAPQLETLDKTSDTTVIREQPGHREVSYGLLIQGPESPFANKNARLAVSYAVDIAKINTIVNLGKNTLATGPFDEDVLGYTKDTGQPAYNVDKAKSAAAAYKKDTGDDLQFRIATTNDPETRQIVELVIQELKTSGITATPIETDQGQLVNDALSKKFEMFWWRNHWGTDPDSQWLWWYSGSLPNFGQINDPEIDGHFQQGRVSSNDADRKTTYEELNQRMGSEAYNMWGWYADWAVATKSDVKGITGPDLPGTDGAPSDARPYPIYAGWHLFSGTWISK